MEHIHLIGIGGTGLSAIARILVEKGYQVSGSDKAASQSTQELGDLGVCIKIGHDSSNIVGAELIVRSSAIQDDNPEVTAARALNIPVLKRSDFMHKLLDPYQTIAVGGTHGKTTTTAMVAWTLFTLGLDPSYIIGGTSKNLQGNAHAGDGNLFVIEADEYDRMFLGLQPSHIIITNIEHDHPDCFPTIEDYQNAFIQFVSQVKEDGCVILCLDDPGSINLASTLSEEIRIITYGFSPEADYRIEQVERISSGGSRFTLAFPKITPEEQAFCSITLNIPGRHNIANAAAAMALINQLGLDIEQAAFALSSFSGSGRRFEIQGEVNGIVLINDYAHHPTEIKATLDAAHDRFPNARIWAVWQPHTYSRTRLLYNEFTQAFTKADKVIVMDVYPARESVQEFPYQEFLEMHASFGCKTHVRSDRDIKLPCKPAAAKRHSYYPFCRGCRSNLRNGS